MNFSGRFYVIASKIADLMILNLLLLICSIPVITIGASITSAYYVALKMTKNRESYIASSFFRSFRQNFRQATAIWLLILGVGILLFVDFRIAETMDGGIFTVFLYLSGLFALLLSFVYLYVFPVLARFYNSIPRTLLNAFYMSLRHLPYTLLMLIIAALPFTILLLNVSMALRLLPVYLLFGFSLPIYLNSYFFNRIFRNYMPEES